MFLFRGVGQGGGDRSLLHYATHTYTHTKKTGHKLHFQSKLHLKSDGPVLFLFHCFKIV